MSKRNRLGHYLKTPPEHPLRKELQKEDWQRIQEAIEGKHKDATVDEIEAAHDVLYDAVAAKMQTHIPPIVLH